MKHFAAAFFLATLAGLASAQTETAAAQDRTMDAERAKISAERARRDADFLAEDAACYRKFAVNSCLSDVSARRRRAMEDLRRQEISLNDEERKIRGVEQIRRTEEKSSIETQQEAAQRRATAVEDSRSRLDREWKKRAGREAAPDSEKAHREANAERGKGLQEKAAARAGQQAVAAQEARKLNERQRQARERQAQHEAERLKQGKPAAKTLPVTE